MHRTYRLEEVGGGRFGETENSNLWIILKDAPGTTHPRTLALADFLYKLLPLGTATPEADTNSNNTVKVTMPLYKECLYCECVFEVRAFRAETGESPTP